MVKTATPDVTHCWTSPPGAGVPSRLILVGLLYMGVALAGAPARADVPAEARKGAELFAESSYTEAAEAFRQATIASPDDVRWRYDLGLSEALDAKYEDALNNLSATSKLAQPEVASAALYNAGNVHMATGKYDEAAKAYRQALLRRPGDLEAKHNLELALRELQKAQQQQKEKGGGDDSTKQNQDEQQDQKKDKQQKKQNSPEDQKQDQNQQNQPGQDSSAQQPPEPKPGQQADSTLSREQAERILRALADHEARLRSQDRKMMAVPAPGGKDW